MATYETTGACTLHTNHTCNVSQPMEEIVGKGHNAKHVKDCTELYLGSKGIEQLAGFERLVNLEVLWLNDNKLSALNGLDSNIRVKQLYAHNNSICTLKGSLPKLEFLVILDLSNNQLKDLNKLLKIFAKMRFIHELNIQGNPCCEEPDYRLLLIHAMPSLQVLDHHQVSTTERLQAAALIGGDARILNVAFGAGVPASVVQHRTAAAQCHNQDQSVLEQELTKMAESIRQKQQQAIEAAEAAQYAANPDAEYWMPRSSLPPPPALLKAHEAWATATAAHSIRSAIATASTHTGAKATGTATGCDKYGMGASATEPWQRISSTLQGCSANGHMLTDGGIGTPSVLQSGVLMGGEALAAAARTYKPKDVLVLHNHRKRSDAEADAAAESGVTCDTTDSRGKVKARYLEGTFRHHLTDRSWEVEANTLKL